MKVVRAAYVRFNTFPEREGSYDVRMDRWQEIDGGRRQPAGADAGLELYSIDFNQNYATGFRSRCDPQRPRSFSRGTIVETDGGPGQPGEGHHHPCTRKRGVQPRA